jgi:HTH-type transcriptional regulator / antitoxin HigA
LILITNFNLFLLFGLANIKSREELMLEPLTIQSLIKTEAQYEQALEWTYQTMKSRPTKGTPQGDAYELVIMLIENYEERHYPVPPLHPIEAIKFYLDQKSINEAESNIIFGSPSRKSEILSGKRKLSLNMIRKLHEKLGIPTNTLIMAY